MVNEVCCQHQCNTLVKNALETTVNKQYGSSPLIRTMQVNDDYFQFTGGEGIL